MVLYRLDCAVDGPIDAGNCEAIAEEFQMVAEGAASFWKALQDFCALYRTWSALEYWFLILCTTLKMLQFYRLRWS
jgi:hypothetical protein